MDKLFTATELSPIRRIIAARMTRARQEIPHFRLTKDLEVSELMRVRREWQTVDSGAPLSLNDIMIKACAGALMDVPEINIQWADTEIHQYSRADISVVIALHGGGISTPVIRGADSKTVWEISREIKDLVARAGRNALKMEEISGGTFSVSNLGMYRVDQFDAIINQPQCAILAIGRTRPEVAVSNGAGGSMATIMSVTLSLDHRAIDGATGARFLAALQARIEQPECLRVVS